MTKKKYDFDEIVDRRKSHSKKWTDWSGLGLEVTDELLPMWIADMDFKTEERILKALHETVDFEVMGYDAPPADYYDSFIDWQKRKNNWDVKEEWLSPVPGVVPGIVNVIRSLTEENDNIIIQPPVYYPFFTAIEANKRNIVENSLVRLDDGTYEIDFEDFEEKAKDASAFVLCNPHNPVGKVISKDDLTRLGEICVENDVLIISDEIHSDLLLEGHTHHVMANLSKEIEDITVTLTAPSKSFNIAGLAQSVIITPNKELRDAVNGGLQATGLMHMSTFGITGFMSAYKYGEEWLAEAMEYIEGNIDYVLEYIEENMPQVKAYKPEATFLMWLDFTEITEDPKELMNLLINKGKILIEDGSVFGEMGKGFTRFNIASPRPMLEDAMKRIEKAIS